MQYGGEPYLLDNHAGKGFVWDIPRDKPVVGFNTGCGDRWTTRLWSIDKWVAVAKSEMAAGRTVLLLGGEQEDARNREIQAKSGAIYPGHFSLPQFINLIDQCDLVVTQVTMGMHLTLGLQKKIVLMNNIFNPFEFDLFGRGKIIAPPKPCKCFYRGTCVDGISCMETLEPAEVHAAIEVVLALP
jgi:heptosyltransferase-2